MHAARVGKIGAKSCVGQIAALRERRRKIGKRICRRKVLRTVETNKRVERKERAWTNQVCPTWSDVEGPDLRALILAEILRIERIRRLKPGAGGGQIEMEGVGLIRLCVQSFKNRL